MRAWIMAAAALTMSCPVEARDITRCAIVVDGTSYVDGPCKFEPLGGGDFNMGDGDYFVYIYPSDQPVMGFWNEERGANHAHTSLGEMIRDGACWMNERVKVCAWQ